jgi:hypothetical protein
MLDLYQIQYEVASFFARLPSEAVLIAIVLIGIVAWRLRLAFAILGAVCAFLLASGYLLFIG